MCYSQSSFNLCKNGPNLTLGLLRGLEESPVDAPLTERDLYKQNRGEKKVLSRRLLVYPTWTSLVCDAWSIQQSVFCSISVYKTVPSVPLAVCGRIQGPARWSGRSLLSNAQNLKAFPLGATAAVARQHRRVDALSRRVCWGTLAQSHHRGFTVYSNTTWMVAGMFLWLSYYCPLFGIYWL